MNVNDNTGYLIPRSVWTTIASKLAPTRTAYAPKRGLYLRATITARIGAGNPSMVLL